jgi:Spy/CpxP family protein refolding chaperone
VKQQIKTLAMIFSVVLNIAFLVGYGVHKLNERPKFAYEELDLSREQHDRLEAARNRFLGDLNKIGDRIEGRHIELIDLIAADSVTPQAIEIKFEEIHFIQSSMQRRVVEHLLEDKQILTPEQRAKFFAVLKSRIQEQGSPGPSWLPAGARQRR